MRILFDQGTPAPLRRELVGHLIKTAYEMGWADLQNGASLDAAERDFDAFITTDQNLQYQQNLSGRRLAILVDHDQLAPHSTARCAGSYCRCRPRTR